MAAEVSLVLGRTGEKLLAATREVRAAYQKQFGAEIYDDTVADLDWLATKIYWSHVKWISPPPDTGA